MGDPPVPGEAELRLDSGPSEARDGQVAIFTRWGPLTAMLAAGYAPQIALLGEGDRVILSEPLDPAMFERARAMAVRMEPELAPLVADYRNRCPFHGS